MRSLERAWPPGVWCYRACPSSFGSTRDRDTTHTVPRTYCATSLRASAGTLLRNCTRALLSGRTREYCAGCTAGDPGFAPAGAPHLHFDCVRLWLACALVPVRIVAFPMIPHSADRRRERNPRDWGGFTYRLVEHPSLSLVSGHESYLCGAFSPLVTSGAPCGAWCVVTGELVGLGHDCALGRRALGGLTWSTNVQLRPARENVAKFPLSRVRFCQFTRAQG